jgi:DNA-binding response OmpR family regulator
LTGDGAAIDHESMPAVPSPNHAPAPHILVAEDDATTRRLIEFKLRREGFAVESLSNGEDLLTRSGAILPALVILDLMMPVKDGYSTLRALRTDTRTAAVPVLVLSGRSDDVDIVRCLEAGANDYMVKPFSPEELVARVRRLLPS